MLAPQTTKANPYNADYVPCSVAYDNEYDDTLMSKEEFFAMLDDAEEEVRRGEVFTKLPEETLTEFLTRIHGCIG
jgi:hypothetical protein